MTVAELRDLDVAVRRREARVPARFGSYEAYCKAVEQGLLSAEPKATYQVRPLEELQQEIDGMVGEPMPPWAPQPSGPTCFGNLIVLSDEFDEQD